MAFEHHLRTPLLYLPLGLLCSLSFCVEHHIGIGGIVVHRGVELNLSTSSERVAYCLVLAQPLTELHDRGLIRCEVHKGVFLQHRQDIEVVDILQYILYVPTSVLKYGGSTKNTTWGVAFNHSKTSSIRLGKPLHIYYRGSRGDDAASDSRLSGCEQSVSC